MATHLPLCSTISISSHSHHSPRLMLANPPPSRRFTVSCNAGDGEGASPPQSKVDRRNLLLGMGGLYGATNLVSPALASPILAPNLDKCTIGRNLNTPDLQFLDEKCCPPPKNEIIDYKLPTRSRVRPAAHLVNDDYIKKYKEAIRVTKEDLSPDDPRSFKSQANVHCAYCNLSYPQTGQGDEKLPMLQIHFGWLFFPWHRWYLYFYERILGEMIGDDTFALPYWNWDDPKGMAIPPMFTEAGSPLYDANRIPDQLPQPNPPLTNLTYAFSRDVADANVNANLREVYVAMDRTQCLEDFYGVKYVTGSDFSKDSGAGAIERGPHTSVHMWVGKDMGNFATAGLDPLFYCHHANVDRMWSIWSEERGKMNRPAAFDDEDFLNTEFLFYDEKKNLVKVKVRDSLDDAKMGFTYGKPEVDPIWLNKKRPKVENRIPLVPYAVGQDINAKDFKDRNLGEVARLKADRPKKGKGDELLVIDGIKVNSGSFVRFEVYVNNIGDKPEEIKAKSEYAGCYSQVPVNSESDLTTKIRLPLTELLEDLKVGDAKQVLVSLVPRVGGEFITIGGVNIVRASC